jgi:aminomethyltransferase
MVISRSGYTGEDGVEISLPAEQAESFAKTLLALPGVMPAGLGARDSLRLEAGLCLYGNDIDETTSPVEANLVWSIGKRRRMEWNFAGAETIRAQLDHGVSRLRVGIQPQGRQPARGHTPIQAGGLDIGEITSGGFGPSVNAPVAMGYVDLASAALGTVVHAMVRGKAVPMTVSAMPFVPNRYYRG